MDRKIIYPGQIPMVEDQLQAARFTQIGVGRLAGALYDESGTGASGFTCAPGSGLSVTISPGQIIQPGVVDASTFGVLPASASALPRQYVLNDPVDIAIPSAGTSYIIYATAGTSDTANTVLPYYNSANPSQTFAGAGNNGQNQPTVRADSVTIGVAASVPSGSIPLWSIVIPGGATAITTAMISVASGAPLYPSLRSLAMRSVAPFNANLAAAFGGYPSKALVADPTTVGIFWVSTADNNLTTPGADGASWVNLFAGLVANEGSANGGINGGITAAAIDGSTKGPTFRDGEGTWYQVVVCKGIYAATLDKSGAPSFLDEEGNWHIVQPAGSYQPAGDYQPAGNYLETDETSQQSVAGPVSFTKNPTGTTAAFGTSDVSFATTEFTTRMNSGRLRGKSVFNSSGTYYPPRQDSSLIFRVRMVAAGGGGATAVPQDTYACNAGAGGTAGSFVDVWFTYEQLFSGVDNTSVQVIIGNGGSANSSGGASSIGNAVNCPGGYGAPFANTGGFSTISPAAPYSASPSFSNGVLFQDVVAPGQSGAMGVVLNPQNGGNFFAFSGNGGASLMGTGGYGVGNGTAGIAGTLGGGGSGACGARSTSGTSAQYTGGFGGNGAAIIECYEGIT